MFNIQKFSRFVAERRQSADMSAAALAEKTGVALPALLKYESGEAFPDVSLLVPLADALGVTLDALIASGDPEPVEACVLKNAALGQDVPADALRGASVCDLANISPLLKPSLLERIAGGLSKHGIDISHIVELAEYLNDENVVRALEESSFEKLDEELLEKLLPMLDDEAKQTIFEKVLNGELDWHFLKKLLPYARYMYQQIEAAVVYGALDWEVIKYMQEVDWQQ